MFALDSTEQPPTKTHHVGVIYQQDKENTTSENGALWSPTGPSTLIRYPDKRVSRSGEATVAKTSLKRVYDVGPGEFFQVLFLPSSIADVEMAC